MTDRWEHVAAILAGLAAVITAAVKGLPPLLRYLGARGREAAERDRREASERERREAAQVALETRVLVALEASAAAVARNSEVHERVWKAILEQGAALERAVRSIETVSVATRVLLEDQRRYCRHGRTPLDSEESAPAASDGEDSSLRLGEG